MIRSQTEMRNMLFGNWKKGDPYKVTRNLVELCACPSVLWKVQLASYKTGYLAEELSKESSEGAD